jgi:hypothetical protein
VAGGVKNAKSPGKTRFKVVKPGQFGAHFGRNRASLGAFELVLIESVLESGPKRPHQPEMELRYDRSISCITFRTGGQQ